MRVQTALLLCAVCALLPGLAQAAPVIVNYQVSPVASDGGTGAGGAGDRIYRYTYTISGGLLAGEELGIEFDPLLYGNLRNPVAPALFDVLLFQPNNPTGSTGLLSALALGAVTEPATLLLDVTYLGNGAPGPQPFSVSAFNDSGGVVLLQSGASAADLTATPEPAAAWIAGTALAALAAARARRLRRRTPRSV